MNHSLELLGREQPGDRVLIGEIHLHELETRVLRENREPRVLQRDVVVLVEIVEPDDLVASLEQVLRCVMPDEAGGAGNQYFQRSAPIARVTDARRKLPSARRA
jgi:hypothetical protein